MTKQSYSIVDIGGNFTIALTDLWEISGVFTNLSPLRIGGQGGRIPEELIDLPILRDPSGAIFIPGSSIKGVLRAQVESYLVSIIASQIQGSICSQLFRGVEPRFFFKECSPVPVKSEEKEEERQIQEVGETAPRYCVNHLLFGCQELASHIHVYDSYADSAETFMRPRVAIDRFTEAARPKALFNVEYVAPGALWKVRFRIYGIPGNNDAPEWRCAYEALAFLLARMSEDGIVVGGHASIGAGVLKPVARKEIKAVHYWLAEPGRMKREEHSLDEYISLLLEKAGVKR